MFAAAIFITCMLTRIARKGFSDLRAVLRGSDSLLRKFKKKKFQFKYTVSYESTYVIKSKRFPYDLSRLRSQKNNLCKNITFFAIRSLFGIKNKTDLNVVSRFFASNNTPTGEKTVPLRCQVVM